MKTTNICIPIGLGDIICIKSYFDSVINDYKQINVCFNLDLVKSHRNDDPKMYEFLHNIGNIFFKKRPYKYISEQIFDSYEHETIISNNNLTPVRPDQKELLCHGTSLNLDKQYIVLTTKVRDLLYTDYISIKEEFFKIINKLSEKYYIVILGEKEIEKAPDYKYYSDRIFEIYNDIIENVKNTVDLTIPAAGVRAPDFKQIQQDCLIMNEARAVITLGIGGNFCMANASGSKMISWRMDNYELNNYLYNEKTYPDSLITKDQDKFLEGLSSLV